MKPLTSEFVKEYFDHMLAHFNAILVPKDEALDFIPGYREFTTVSDALTMMGVNNPAAFFRRASITIGPYVCPSYVPGVGSDATLDYQCRNLAHEITHRIQWGEDPLGFLANYLTSRSKRSAYEIDASKPEMEISFYRKGKIISIAGKVESLKKNYYIRNADANVAKLHLEAYAATVKDGAICSVVGKEAIRFMQENGF